MGHTYTEEEKAWLSDKANYWQKPWSEVLAAFNEKFNCNITKYALKGIRHKLELHNGITDGGRFEKGHVPVNKGKPLSPEVLEKISKTWFQKGHQPANTLPVGSRVRWCDKRDGCSYWATKIKAEGSHRTGAWKMDHYILWEKHFGKVPEGHVLVFIDGNTDNLTIENLRCVKRSTHCVINSHRKHWDIQGEEELNIFYDIYEIKGKMKELNEKA